MTLEANAGGMGALNEALLSWFDQHGRDLAFRRTRDPYAILVAEVMLQQTQVARVEPAWRRFVARFPTPGDLAAASPADAIRAWAGLGYNARAVRLQRAAAAIVRDHQGAVPRTVSALVRLPGIGQYTARAIAATAFGVPAAPVDTNIGRIVRRVFGVRPEPDPAARVQEAADAWIDRARPAAWVHGLMDVGATICLARAPRCPACPLRASCATARLDASALMPPRGSSGPRAGARSGGGFPGTRRWLRGRILARLREERDGRWVRIGGPIGEHGEEAVAHALQRLAAEGLLELDRVGRARLPQTVQGSSGAMQAARP